VRYASKTIEAEERHTMQRSWEGNMGDEYAHTESELVHALDITFYLWPVYILPVHQALPFSSISICSHNLAFCPALSS
jgi:hypothetical protein